MAIKSKSVLDKKKAADMEKVVQAMQGYSNWSMDNVIGQACLDGDWPSVYDNLALDRDTYTDLGSIATMHQLSSHRDVFPPVNSPITPMGKLMYASVEQSCLKKQWKDDQDVDIKTKLNELREWLMEDEELVSYVTPTPDYEGILFITPCHDGSFEPGNSVGEEFIELVVDNADDPFPFAGACIAGGCVLGLIKSDDQYSATKDIDVFIFEGEDKVKGWNNFMNVVAWIFRHFSVKILSVKHHSVITFRLGHIDSGDLLTGQAARDSLKRGAGYYIDIDLVLTGCLSAEEVVVDFHMDYCQFALTQSGVIATPQAALALFTSVCSFHSHGLGTSRVSRTLTKNFDIEIEFICDFRGGGRNSVYQDSGPITMSDAGVGSGHRTINSQVLQECYIDCFNSFRYQINSEGDIKYIDKSIRGEVDSYPAGVIVMRQQFVTAFNADILDPSGVSYVPRSLYRGVELSMDGERGVNICRWGFIVPGAVLIPIVPSMALFAGAPHRNHPIALTGIEQYTEIDGKCYGVIPSKAKNLRVQAFLPDLPYTPSVVALRDACATRSDIDESTCTWFQSAAMLDMKYVRAADEYEKIPVAVLLRKIKSQPQWCDDSEILERSLTFIGAYVL